MNKLVIAFAILAHTHSFGQDSIRGKTIPLSEVKFTSIFGQHSSDSTLMYCLLGTGFFRTPRSDNADVLTSHWLDKHKDAMIIPVSTLIDTAFDLTYCLVVDKNDTLNVYLVRNGCFPGGTMQRPPTWDEMSPDEQSIYTDIEKEHGIVLPRPDVRVHIDTASYERYIQQIINAEKYATENKLGLWKSEE